MHYSIKIKMDKLRIDKINKIWHQLHGDNLPYFYWCDGTNTEYHYDIQTNSIVSDNGFSITVDLSTNELSKEYISNLIDMLETNIIEYYRTVHNYELWEE